jgi:hypothetical protein
MERDAEVSRSMLWKILFWLWLAPYVIAYALGFATALLIGPIRSRWLRLYDEAVDPPNVKIPFLSKKH